VGRQEKGGVMPDNRGDVVKVLPGQDPLTRVVIVKRSDGHYAIRPEKWQKRVFLEGVIAPRWVPRSQVSGIFESVELAERQAYIDYPWIRPLS
jgi:hypothetical protein